MTVAVIKVDEVSLHNLDIKYSKTCLKLPLKNRQNKDLYDKR